MRKTLDSKISLELLTEVIKTIDEYGIEGTLNILKESRAVNDGTLQLKNYIIHIVCKKYNVTKHKVLTKTKADENLHNAKCVISYLIYKHCKLNQLQIGKEIKRSYSIVSRYINYVEGLSPNFKHEQKLMDEIKDFENSIQQYKLKQIQNG